MFNAGLIGTIFDAADKVHNNIRNDAIFGYNIFNQERNNKNQVANKNWAYADSRAANEMMTYYLKNGSLDGFDKWNNGVSGQDYNDVADYFNPFLSLSSLNLAQRGQQLSEDQFKYSKYTTENAAQIRVNDLKKAGLSPLLALGNTASYSPVGISSSGVPGNTSKNRPSYNNLSSLGYTSAGAPIAQSFLALEQARKLRAETKLINNQAEKTSEDIKKIREETKLIAEKINNTKYATMLTQNQIEFVAQEIAHLQWNLDLSKDNGIKTFEDTPYLMKNIQSILSGVGIDVNSDLGKGLVSILMTGIILGGQKVKTTTTVTTKKGNTTTTKSTYK